jgi:hypothetical protein
MVDFLGGVGAKNSIVIGIVGIILVVGLFFVIFTSFTSNQNPSPSTENVIVSQDEDEDDSRPQPTGNNQQPASPSPIASVKADYTLSYPQGWQYELRAVAGGGTQSMIKIPNPPPDTSNAKVLIQGTPSSQSSPTGVAEIFESLKYTKDSNQLLIDNTPAVKYTGFQDWEGKFLQETAIVLGKNNTTYLIKLSYFSQTKNQQLEDEFLTSAQSIKFN